MDHTHHGCSDSLNLCRVPTSISLTECPVWRGQIGKPADSYGSLAAVENLALVLILSVASITLRAHFWAAKFSAGDSRQVLKSAPETAGTGPTAIARLSAASRPWGVVADPDAAPCVDAGWYICVQKRQGAG